MKTMAAVTKRTVLPGKVYQNGRHPRERPLWPDSPWPRVDRQAGRAYNSPSCGSSQGVKALDEPVGFHGCNCNVEASS